MEDATTLVNSLQAAFRDDNTPVQDGIQRAMEGLRFLHTLDMSALPSKGATSAKAKENLKKSKELKGHIELDPQQWVEEVDWLEPLPDMDSSADLSFRAGDKDSDSKLFEFPVFPLSSPTFPKEDLLPVVSQFSDVPVSGMEIPLKIFEPRYRQMYNDLLTTSTSPGSPISRKAFIVPFSHPYRSGQYASFGWLYEIMQVQDVADETNGRFQLVCNHLVTKPVKIISILNPSAHDDQTTYLRAKAEILDEDFGDGGAPGNIQQINEPLEKLLRELQQQSASPSSSFTATDKILIDRLLMALAEGSLWSVTQVWVLNLQMQILELQARIADKIQKQAAQTLRQHPPFDSEEQQENGNVTKEMVLLAQEPHKDDLKCMLMEVSTLVPLLLQDSSQKSKCERLCQRIQKHFQSQLDDATETN